MILLSFVIGISFISCTDNFDSTNSSKYSPGEASLEGDFNLIGIYYNTLQSNVILSEQNAYQFNENLTGHPYGRFMSITNDGWNDASFSVFNAPINWLNSVFNDQFTGVYTSWFKLKSYMEERNQLTHFTWAWAEILRVAAVHRTTDMYGPIPYTEIKKNTGTLLVGYDDQKAVYQGLFEDLDKAINIMTAFVLSGAGEDDSPFTEFDMVYGGDFSKWVKFANSLKLRMAMRIVYVDPVNAKKYAEEAVSHPIGVIQSNDDNAWLRGMKNPISVMWGPYGDSRVCADIVTYMRGYKDPRMEKYFQKSKPSESLESGFYGLRTGIKITNKAWGQGFSNPNIKENDNLLWMCAAEVAFLRAEGVLWKWNMGMGTAESYYKDGIDLSFSQWGANGALTYTNDDISIQDSYFEDDKNTVGPVSDITIKWDESASFERKQERILTQKWIAIYPLGHEAWAEHRRTGYPRFFPVVVNKSSDPTLSTKLASRLPYGPYEKQDNSENYNKAVSLLGGTDNYSTRLWWDKKNK